MNLLLLLSALLSALTGVAGGGRGAEPRAVAEQVLASPVSAKTAVATRRPANVVRGVAELAVVRVSLPEPPVATAPLYLQRRRE